MNYIKHLTGFFNKSDQDITINPTHISLYLALFQRWNLNRFKNPIIISREEMMVTSKIKSKATYHKCMKELHDRNYIIYKPSFNPYEGTEVILPDLSIICNSQISETSSEFDHSESNNELPVVAETRENERNSNNVQDRQKKYEVKNQTASVLNTSSNFNQSESKNELLSSKNNKNALTSSNFERTLPKNELVQVETRPKNERTELKNGQVDEQVYIYNNKTLVNINKTIYESDEKTRIKKEENKSEFIVPTIDLITEFFQEKKVSTIEAEKYFNYYGSNGWKVGGKTPMKDWKAAARNWILNLDKFKVIQPINQLSPNNLNVSNAKDKDYAEPL